MMQFRASRSHRYFLFNRLGSKTPVAISQMKPGNTPKKRGAQKKSRPSYFVLYKSCWSSFLQTVRIGLHTRQQICGLMN
jgi:hypothetical protein